MKLIYSEKRIGKSGKPFSLYKIKTLKDKSNGEEVKVEEEKDMIISNFHRVLRKYGIDEIPQIVNILLGDMNVFGVRPIKNSGLQEYSSGDKERYLSYKPGILGEFSLESRTSKKRDELGYDYGTYIRRAFLRLRRMKDKESLNKRISFYSFVVLESVKQVISGHDKNI